MVVASVYSERERAALTLTDAVTRITGGHVPDFLPPGVKRLQRRARALAMLIREAFLRGLSTRQVGRVVGTLTGEGVSAQTVSRLICDLDEAVCEFHRAPLADEWAYLFLDGVSLRVRRQRDASEYRRWWPGGAALRAAAVVGFSA